MRHERGEPGGGVVEAGDLMGTGATREDNNIPGEVGLPFPELGFVELVENVGDLGDSGVRGSLNPPTSTLATVDGSVLLVCAVSKLDVSFESERKVGGGLPVGGRPVIDPGIFSRTGFNEVSICDWLCSDMERDIKSWCPLLIDRPTESGFPLDIDELLIIIDSGSLCSFDIERLCVRGKSGSVSRVALRSVMGERAWPTVRSGGERKSKLIVGSWGASTG